MIEVASEGTSRSFYERFNIEVGTDEAKQRFMNRVSNLVFADLYHSKLIKSHEYSGAVPQNVAYRLGEVYTSYRPGDYVRGDFKRCLHVLEAMYEALQGSHFARELSDIVDRVLQDSESDIGVDWQPPVFVRTGARLLDESLVNEPLHWLSEPKYKTVYDPFEKGLSHYLEAEKKPHVLADVVTDMYEAVEALARIVTGKNKELSGNQQSFIKAIGASDYYKGLLKDYVSYANHFRHAVRLGQPRPTLSEPEVESFI